MSLIMHRYTIAAAFLLAFAAPASAAPVDAALKELRQTFTIDHKPVPPQVFADFGDSDMADSGSIRVTIDLLAAMGGNLYFGDIKGSPGGWLSQKIGVAAGDSKPTEEIGYQFDGVTRNGLIVVTAAYSSGGSGDFIYLHILDAAPARAFDSEGKLYDRLNLTVLRSVPLGDRWQGEIKITGDAIAIVTAPTEIKHNDRPAGTQRIQAVRP
jgi:hypothetical protein